MNGLKDVGLLLAVGFMLQIIVAVVLARWVLKINTIVKGLDEIVGNLEEVKLKLPGRKWQQRMDANLARIMIESTEKEESES